MTNITTIIEENEVANWVKSQIRRASYYKLKTTRDMLVMSIMRGESGVEFKREMVKAINNRLNELQNAHKADKKAA